MATGHKRARWERGWVRARAAPQWGHLNHRGGAAHWLFALALDRAWWTKTILCRSTCCFGQLIAPEEILNLLLLFTGTSFGLGCSLGCAPMLMGRAASHPWDGGPWSHLCLFLLDFFAIVHVKVGRFAADLQQQSTGQFF